MTAALLRVLLAAQVLAGFVLIARLARGRRRDEPVAPVGAAFGSDADRPRATVVVPVLNEARRIAPLLDALATQRARVAEILVVDSGSTDGTPALVEAAAAADPRIRLIVDPPLPGGWIGKAWALEHARAVVSAEWIVGLDADTAPEPDAVAAALSAAESRGLDAVSFGPKFAGQSALERFVHPSILATLVYRTGPPGTNASPDTVLANGQFFVVRAAVLDQLGGYAPARGSFSEDVSLARHLARNGARVAFLDGSRLFSVRSYASAREMWREWGRSVDLRDATHRGRQAIDMVFLSLVQAVPLPLVAAAAIGAPMPAALVWLNGALIAVRCMLSVALAPSYERRGTPFWLSPLSDPIAVLRVVISTLRRPRQWRGRSYNNNNGGRSDF